MLTSSTHSEQKELPFWQYLTSQSNKSVITSFFPPSGFIEEAKLSAPSLATPVFLFFPKECSFPDRMQRKCTFYWNCLLLSKRATSASLLFLKLPLATHVVGRHLTPWYNNSLTAGGSSTAAGEKKIGGVTVETWNDSFSFPPSEIPFTDISILIPDQNILSRPDRQRTMAYYFLV